jgi:hypothetical protein
MKLLKIESNNHIKNLFKITLTTLALFIANGVLISLVLFAFSNSLENEIFTQSTSSKFEISEFFSSLLLVVFVAGIYEELVFRFNIKTSSIFAIIIRLLWASFNVIFFHIVLRFNNVISYSILLIIIILSLSSLFFLPNILMKYDKNQAFKKIIQVILNLFFIILHPIFLTFISSNQIRINDNSLLITLTILATLSLIINSIWYTYLRNSSENNKITFWYSVYAHGLFNFFILLIGTINL